MKLLKNKLTYFFQIRLRRKRFALLLKKINKLNKPVSILDVGGTQEFWEDMKFTETNWANITLLNMMKIKTHYNNLCSVVGDARNMSEFHDNQFDMVFSNAVIEHMNNLSEQFKMAKEISRVGKNYFVQTPSYWFPIESHSRTLFFQFLPKKIKIKLLMNYSLGNFTKANDFKAAEEVISSINLLTKRKLCKCFLMEFYEKKKFYYLQNLI